MKICFNYQSANENKSPLLDALYPYIVYEVEDEFECPVDFIEMSTTDFATYESSFDITAYLASIAPPIQPVGARQIRLALFQNSVTEEMIDATIAAMDEPQKSITTINWKHAISFERQNEFVELVGAAMGMTPTEIDDLWELAKTL